jgi:uncharacterized membrane protein
VINVVLSLDFLDTMAWDIVIGAALLAIGSLKLHYKFKEGRFDAEKNLRLGFAIAAGASGFYLFITGLSISFMWPFAAQSSGVYNVLFGGIATLGGLLLLAGSVAVFKDADLRPITYFAFVAGLYALVDSYAIMHYSLTNSPIVATLGYLGFAAPAIISVPAAHLSDKRWRYIFAVFAFLFAAVWFIEAATFTIAHLEP